MKQSLTALGFDCFQVLDATRESMLGFITKFIELLEPHDIAFIYYSGHGEEFGGDTYLLPTDYGQRDRTMLRYWSVSLNTIIQDLIRKDCELINIIVLDCCRSNVEDATFRGIPRSRGLDARGGEFVRKPTTGQFCIAYSADPGTAAFEGRGESNGWFTGCLLQHLLTPGLLIEQIFKRANAALELKSKKQQRAWHESSLKEDIILVPIA